MSTPAIRLKIAQQIVDWEAERDPQGNLIVDPLPADDGGGSWEVAGCNSVYDTPVAQIIREFIQSGQPSVGEKLAVVYIAQNTDVAASYTNIAAVEATLRDIVFNRGATGMIKTLQIALKVDVDGQFGVVSHAALVAAEASPSSLLIALHDARKTYELTKVGERSNLEAGLQNRWDNCLAFSLTLLS